jgi:hypothetical protein
MNPITVQPGKESILLGPGIFSIVFDAPGAGQTGHYEVHYYDHQGHPTGHYINGKITSKFHSEDNLNKAYKFRVKNTGLNYPITFR